MKHKEFIAGVVLGGVIFGSITIFANDLLNVTINPFKVKVDGIERRIEGYNINGNTYFKLRDIGEYVGFDVDFKEETILIKTFEDFIQTDTKASSSDVTEDLYISKIDNMLSSVKPRFGLMNDGTNIGYYYSDLNLLLNNTVLKGNYIHSDDGDTYYLQLFDKSGKVIIEHIDPILIRAKLCLSPSYFINTILPLDN